MNATIATRKGDGLIELEQALEHILAASAMVPPNSRSEIVLKLDLACARQLRAALQFARSNGVAVQ